MNFNKIVVKVGIGMKKKWIILTWLNYFIDILKWCWTENWNLQRNE